MARCRYKSLLKEVEKTEGFLEKGDRLNALIVVRNLRKTLKAEVEKMERKGVNPAVPELLSWAYRTYEEETGNPVAKNWGRDGRILSDVLEQLKDHAKEDGTTPEELFKSLWDLFINRYKRKRAEGFPYFKTQIQKLYEWWKSEVNAPIDFGESGRVSTEPADHDQYYDGEF